MRQKPVNSVISTRTATLWPGQCLLCGQYFPENTRGTTRYGALRGAPLADICPGCRYELPLLTAACNHCGLPLPAGIQHGSCANCARHPLFDNCFAVYEYAYPVAELIQALKFNRRLVAGRLLGHLFAEEYLRHAWHRKDFRRDEWRDEESPERSKPDVLIPVPLHWRRQLGRGFNQADELSLPVSRALNIPFKPNWVVRRVFAAPQSALNRQHRRSNLQQARRKGIFSVPERYRSRVEGLHVAIMDDVITTGSTALAMHSCLHAAGAASVSVWAIARTLRG